MSLDDWDVQPRDEAEFGSPGRLRAGMLRGDAVSLLKLLITPLVGLG